MQEKRSPALTSPGRVMVVDREGKRRVAAAATTAVEEEDGDYGYIARVADTVEGDCEREWPVARKNSRTGW